MADLDLETVEQVVRWCAEAGRQTTPAEVRAALGQLGWDELLAARALLADPPPTRQLGPHALADMARGAPTDVAAEREREGRYPRAPSAVTGPPGASSAAPPAVAAPTRRKRGRARLAVIVRKRAPAPDPAPPPPPRPVLDELLLPAGRGALERLLREQGGRRPALLASLTGSHRRPDGLPLGDADLDRLLEHHGLARSFARRERDELLHAVRAAAGVMARAARALGFDESGLAAAVDRLGCRDEVDSFRAGKRRDLAGRATLSDRARLVIADPEKLRELGLLEPFEAELRARLPELLTALARSGEPLAMALARSIGLPVRGVRELAVRLGLDLGPVTFAETAAGDRPLPRFRADRPVMPPRPPRAGPSRAGPARERPPRAGPGRAGPPRAGPSASSPPPVKRASGFGARSGAPRTGGARPGGRPSSSAPSSSAPGFRRPIGPEATGRPGRGPAGPVRPGGRSSSRPGAPRPGGSRTGSSRPAAPRPGPRRPGSRPASSPRGPRPPRRTP